MGSSRRLCWAVGKTAAGMLLAGLAVVGCAPTRPTPVSGLQLQVVQSGVPVLGDCRFVVEATNPGRRPRALVASLQLAEPSGRILRQEQRLLVGPGDSRRCELTCQPAELGPHSGSLRISEAGRGLVYELPDLRLVVRPPWEFTADRSYYTSEPVLRFRSRLHQGSVLSARLVVELRSGGVVRVRQVVEGRQSEVEGRLSLAGLPPGTYALCARVEGAAGVDDSAAVEVRKYPAAGREVKIDRFSQGLLVDGQPFFPVGLYWVRAEMLAEARRLGFNCGDYYYKLQGEQIAALMDEAGRAGIGVLVELTPWVRGRAEPDWQAIDDVVARYRRHRALLAWYLVDEPADHEVDPAQARKAYKRVRAADPYHPVYLVNNRPATYARYADACDIIGVDVYPVPSQPLSRVRQCVQQAAWASAEGKPVWLVAQAFGGVEHWGRPPTPRELRNMVYQGLVNGAQGVLFYRYCQPEERRIQPSELWREVQALAAEMATLAPALAAPDRPGDLVPVGDNGGVDGLLARHGASRYLLLVNADRRPHRARYQLGGVGPLARVQPMHGAPAARVRDGVLTTQMPALGTAVYRLEPVPM